MASKWPFVGWTIIKAGKKVSEKGNYSNVALSPKDESGEQDALAFYSKRPYKLGEVTKTHVTIFQIEADQAMEAAG